MFVAALLMMLPDPAHAYIGPGAGLGAIAVTVAVLLGVLFLFVGLLWFPLKRLLRGSKDQADEGSGSDAAQ
ncbi:hypothetical protein [Ruegeria sp.]|uniref:hypothetical protein n=1 Tax=Ruegeria sp. TaxID=1879320 RepID=UPI003B5C81DA